MKYYLHIREELTVEEMTNGAEPQTIHIEVEGKQEAINLLPQYEPFFIANGRPFVKEFRTNRHAEKQPCLKEDL